MLRRSFARCTRPGMVGVMALACISLSSIASAQLRVASYNIAQLQGNMTSLEDVLIELHADDREGFAVPVSVFIFQEVRSIDLAPLQAVVTSTAPPGTSYSGATYTSFPGEDGSAGAVAMFYDADLLLEDLAAHGDLATGGGRFTDRWRLCLNGYASDSACFYVYGSHLKAGNSGQDADERHEGVLTIRADSATLPAATHIIYAGDMNFSSAAEAGYLEFIAGGVGGAVDPIGGSWGGGANASKHTQSPREGSSGGLVGGGLNDRFDFQLPTTEFHDADGLTILTSTYRALGNDGTHYDQAINDGNNTYFPDDIPRSNLLANDLHNASDHIPVVVDYQIPAKMTALLAPDYGRVIQGAVFDVLYFLSNDAPVQFEIGGDTLDVLATGTGGLSGFVSESLPALSGLLPGGFALDTSSTGVVNGTAIFTTSNEGVSPSVVSLDTTGTVVRTADPSFDSIDDIDNQVLQFTFGADTGFQTFDVEVFNFEFDALQALLDVDDVTGGAASYAFDGGLASGIGAGSATLSFSFDTTGLAPGSYSATFTIETSDEDLPGETLHAITLDIDVIIDGARSCPGDCADGGDGAVDVVDVLALLAQWGTDASCDIAPGDGDGTIDVQDLLLILAAWGPCP